jgi:hypothetical protein
VRQGRKRISEYNDVGLLRMMIRLLQKENDKLRRSLEKYEDSTMLPLEGEDGTSPVDQESEAERG